MRPRLPPLEDGGAFHRIASESTRLRVAVETLLRCCSPAAIAASITFCTRCPVVAEVKTVVAQSTHLSFTSRFLVYSFMVPVSLSGTMSHLFTTITTAFPSCSARTARRKSCSVAPMTASRTSTVTSERRMARRALLTLSSSAPSLLFPTLARFRMPAVSISLYTWPSSICTLVSIASIVVPLMALTIERSSPQMALSKLLLPTLGRPTMAMLSSPPMSPWASMSGGGRESQTWSRRSEVPVPWRPETASGSPSPRLQNSLAWVGPWVGDSHLLIARRIFLVLL
mmetsp:Transcript_56049/g.177614  ORF Transcript_56049/g.177614 Transcript_56049/m.177614 type:complete len:284 (-) Transcript_56049:201-1052(-)